MNNGKTIGFEVGPNSPPVKLTADIFEGKTYVLKQFHLHFGCEGEKGSEHSIDGEKFSGEVRKMKILPQSSGDFDPEALPKLRTDPSDPYFNHPK